PDLGRGRGRRSAPRRRPADQRLSRSRLLGVPEDLSEQMSRARMKGEPTAEGRALPVAPARHAGIRILLGASLVVCAANAVAQAPRPGGAVSATTVVREE